MNALQDSLKAAKERLNAQIYAHNDETGISLKQDGWDMHAGLASDGQSLLIVVKLADGFMASAVVENFVNLFNASKATVH